MCRRARLQLPFIDFPRNPHGRGMVLVRDPASDAGTQAALAAAKAMAKTAIELLGSPALRDAIRAEWSAR